MSCHLMPCIDDKAAKKSGQQQLQDIFTSPKDDTGEQRGSVSATPTPPEPVIDEKVQGE